MVMDKTPIVIIIIAIALPTSCPLSEPSIFGSPERYAEAANSSSPIKVKSQAAIKNGSCAGRAVPAI